MSDETKAPEALVQELRQVFMVAATQAMLGNRDLDEHGEPRVPTSGVEAGIRAVLSHLARQGVEGLAESTLGVLIERVRHATDCTADHCQDRDAGLGVAIELCDAIEPLLAARDAALEEARARVELLETRDAHFQRAEAAQLAAEREAHKHTRRRADAAEKKLAAVMALTEDDLLGAGLGPENKGIPGILALIRRRAGAEAGPDPDIAATVQEHAVGPMPPAPDELEYERNEP